MRKALFELVIDKCLEIDVNITIKDNGEVTVEEETKDVEEKANDGGDNTGARAHHEFPVNANDVDQLSDTLDSLLALLMRTMSQGCSDGHGAREVYYEILPVFESTIITTHKSKFVQYCLFYLCGVESERTPANATPVAGASGQEHSILHRDFASKLLEIVVDPYRSMLTRQSAACYLASFVSRASYVEAETVCESISTLLRWAEAYMDSLAVNSIWAADAREQSELHSLFYTVCQAAFYIMCFRGTDALRFSREALKQFDEGESTGRADLPSPNDIDLGVTRWTRVCSHELQPLRFCLESVRSEFLHVAHFFTLVEEHVLDKLVVDAKRMSTGRVNKKAASTIKTAATLEKQRRKGGVGGLGRGSNPLKSFFPFDPLLLRRSNVFVEPFYMHWQGPVEEEDVLVIDEVPDNEYDQVFEMDEDEAGGDSDDEEEEVPVVVSDQETKEEPESDAEDKGLNGSPTHTKEQRKRDWAETTKRPRSQSMENGSW
jgi:RNA polymerase I-specific transcription initiation factor RRN3